jgi:hypothetical protein
VLVVVFVGVGVFTCAMIAPEATWLSRFPTEPLSTAVTRMWKGSPEILVAPSPRPQPRRPTSAARCPPQRSIMSVVAELKLKETVTSVSVSLPLELFV